MALGIQFVNYIVDYIIPINPQGPQQIREFSHRRMVESWHCIAPICALVSQSNKAGVEMDLLHIPCSDETPPEQIHVFSTWLAANPYSEKAPKNEGSKPNDS